MEGWQLAVVIFVSYMTGWTLCMVSEHLHWRRRN